MICSTCTGGRCAEEPHIEPIRLPCEACDDGRVGEEDCGRCEGMGFTLLKQCPKRAIRADAWEILLEAEMAERGILPVAGGSLDQTQSFIEVMNFVQVQRAGFRAKTAK